MRARTMRRIAWIRAYFSRRCWGRGRGNENGPHTARLGDRVRGGSGGFGSDLCSVRAACGGGAARRELLGTRLRRDWVRVHDFCGGAWSAEARADVAAGTRPGMDARTFVAGAAVAADCDGGERHAGSSAAALFAAQDDGGCATRDDL